MIILYFQVNVATWGNEQNAYQAEYKSPTKYVSDAAPVTEVRNNTVEQAACDSSTQDNMLPVQPDSSMGDLENNGASSGYTNVDRHSVLYQKSDMLTDQTQESLVTSVSESYEEEAQDDSCSTLKIVSVESLANTDAAAGFDMEEDSANDSNAQVSEQAETVQEHTLYQCLHCPLSTVTVEDMTIHIEQGHKADVDLTCPLCLYTSKEISAVYQHLSHVHNQFDRTHIKLFDSDKHYTKKKVSSEEIVQAQLQRVATAKGHPERLPAHSSLSADKIRSAGEISTKFTKFDDNHSSWTPVSYSPSPVDSHVPSREIHTPEVSTTSNQPEDLSQRSRSNSRDTDLVPTDLSRSSTPSTDHEPSPHYFEATPGRIHSHKGASKRKSTPVHQSSMVMDNDEPINLREETPSPVSDSSVDRQVQSRTWTPPHAHKGSSSTLWEKLAKRQLMKQKLQEAGARLVSNESELKQQTRPIEKERTAEHFDRSMEQVKRPRLDHESSSRHMSQPISPQKHRRNAHDHQQKKTPEMTLQQQLTDARYNRLPPPLIHVGAAANPTTANVRKEIPPLIRAPVGEGHEKEHHTEHRREHSSSRRRSGHHSSKKERAGTVAAAVSNRAAAKPGALPNGQSQCIVIDDDDNLDLVKREALKQFNIRPKVSRTTVPPTSSSKQVQRPAAESVFSVGQFHPSSALNFTTAGQTATVPSGRVQHPMVLPPGFPQYPHQPHPLLRTSYYMARPLVPGLSHPNLPSISNSNSSGRTSSPQQLFRCPYCTFNAPDPDSMHNHILTHGQNNILWTCPYCTVPTHRKKADIEQHIRACHPGQRVLSYPYGVPV